MKSFTATLLVAIFLSSATSSFGRTVTKTYSGSYKGQPCTVQMNWRNWEGLGAVDGVIVSNGATIPFSGINPQAGIVDLNVAGESIRVLRKGAGTWAGGKLSITEGGPRPTPSPTPTASPSPTEEALTPLAATSEPRMVDESYTGKWRGQDVTVQIRWAPGDEPGVMRRGRGTMTVAGAQPIPLEGVQSSAEAAEFRIKPGENGETLKTTKTNRDGNQAWEGEALILSEKK